MEGVLFTNEMFEELETFDRQRVITWCLDNGLEHLVAIDVDGLYARELVNHGTDLATGKPMQSERTIQITQDQADSFPIRPRSRDASTALVFPLGYTHRTVDDANTVIERTWGGRQDITVRPTRTIQTVYSKQQGVIANG